MKKSKRTVIYLMNLDEIIANISEEDLQKLNEAYYKRQGKTSLKKKKVTYRYSKITANILKKLVDIERKLDRDIFNQWFKNNKTIDKETILVFEKLISENELLIDTYSEEDLKVNVLIPILNKVHFKSFKNEFRDFYELLLRYETKSFIFNGTADFVVAKGLIESKKPYFFIQEFKKGQQAGYPEPQLLAELISGVELNQWQEIKGIYIIGSLWYFVILQKLALNKYQYFVSIKFDSMRIDDLKMIYNNLLFVKNEIMSLRNN